MVAHSPSGLLQSGSLSQSAAREFDTTIIDLILEDLAQTGSRNALLNCCLASKFISSLARRHLFANARVDADHSSALVLAHRLEALPFLSHYLTILRIEGSQPMWLYEESRRTALCYILNSVDLLRLGLVNRGRSLDFSLIHDDFRGALVACLSRGRLDTLQITGFLNFSVDLLNLPRQLQVLSLEGMTFATPRDIVKKSEHQDRYAIRALEVWPSVAEWVIDSIKNPLSRQHSNIHFEEVRSLSIHLYQQPADCLKAFELVRLLGRGDNSNLTSLSINMPGRVNFAYLTCVKDLDLATYHLIDSISLAPCVRLKRLTAWVRFNWSIYRTGMIGFGPDGGHEWLDDYGEDWFSQLEYDNSFGCHRQVLLAWTRLLQTAPSSLEYIELNLDNFNASSIQLHENFATNGFEDGLPGIAWRELDETLSNAVCLPALRAVEILIHLPEGTDCSSCSNSDCGDGCLFEHMAVPINEWSEMAIYAGTSTFDEDVCKVVASHLRNTIVRLGEKNVMITAVVSAN